MEGRTYPMDGFADQLADLPDGEHLTLDLRIDLCLQAVNRFAKGNEAIRMDCGSFEGRTQILRSGESYSFYSPPGTGSNYRAAFMVDGWFPDEGCVHGNVPTNSPGISMMLTLHPVRTSR